MKIIDKYVLREYITSLIYCLSAFSILVVVFDLSGNLSKILAADTPSILIAKYYALFLLLVFELVVPASLLLATLYTLWQFTRHSELIAMRASGMSLFRIMLPFLAVGLAFSISLVTLHETVFPEIKLWVSDYKDSHFKKSDHRTHENYSYLNAQDRRQWHIGTFNVQDPGKLLDVEITQERADDSKEMKITASEAQWLDEQWWFIDAKIQRFDKQENRDGPATIAPLKEFWQLNETPTDFVNTTKEEFLSSIQLAKHIRNHPDMREKELYQKKKDFHSGLAMPWACFVITLFGIPVGAKSGRQNALAGIFISIALLLGFYAVMQLGTILAEIPIEKQVFPAWFCGWLSNIVFLITGIIMTKRML